MLECYRKKYLLLFPPPDQKPWQVTALSFKKSSRSQHTLVRIDILLRILSNTKIRLRHRQQQAHACTFRIAVEHALFDPTSDDEGGDLQG